MPTRPRPSRAPSVAGRVALVLVGVQVLTALVAVGLSAYLAEGRLRTLAASGLRLRLESVAEEVERRASPPVRLDRLPEHVRRDLDARFPDPVTLVAPDGRVIERIGGDRGGAAPPLPPGLDALLAAGDAVVDERGGGAWGTYGLAPVFDADGLVAGGVLVQPLGASLALELAPARAAYGRAFVLVSAGALAVALVLGGLFARRLVRPLRTITHGVERIGSGDFAARLGGEGPGEIGRLALAVNAMAADVEASVDALRGADAMRRDLVANVGHDLRTPLAALSGYVETARAHVAAARPDDADAALEGAERQAAHLARLVADLFELAVLEGAPEPLRLETVPLGELLADAAGRHRPLLARAGVAFALEVPPGLPAIRADGVRLLRLLDNLLANARAHTSAGGAVTLRARVDGEAAVVEVEDTGAGIPETEQPHLFERYYRGAGARTRADSGGTGLGLAIAATIAWRHGGTLAVESAEGRGSTFTLRLPLAEASGGEA